MLQPKFNQTRLPKPKTLLLILSLSLATAITSCTPATKDQTLTERLAEAKGELKTARESSKQFQVEIKQEETGALNQQNRCIRDTSDTIGCQVNYANQSTQLRNKKTVGQANIDAAIIEAQDKVKRLNDELAVEKSKAKEVKKK